jgi:hypothetical protein
VKDVDGITVVCAVAPSASAIDKVSVLVWGEHVDDLSDYSETLLEYHGTDAIRPGKGRLETSVAISRKLCYIALAPPLYIEGA